MVSETFLRWIIWKRQITPGSKFCMGKGRANWWDSAVLAFWSSGGCRECVQHRASRIPGAASAISVSTRPEARSTGARPSPKHCHPPCPLLHTLRWYGARDGHLLCQLPTDTMSSHPEDAKAADRIKHLLFWALKEITFVEHAAARDGSPRPWGMWNELNSGSLFQGKMKKN